MGCVFLFMHSKLCPRRRVPVYKLGRDLARSAMRPVGHKEYGRAAGPPSVAQDCKCHKRAYRKTLGMAMPDEKRLH